MLFISGDQAHSKEFSQGACNRVAEPRELVWVKGAGHVDLYDRVDLIPFDKLSIFDQHLAARLADAPVLILGAATSSLDSHPQALIRRSDGIYRRLFERQALELTEGLVA
jgi:fermentation-respiration switch protein FrsA (DUF1100 family)